MNGSIKALAQESRRWINWRTGYDGSYGAHDTNLFFTTMDGAVFWSFLAFFPSLVQRKLDLKTKFAAQNEKQNWERRELEEVRKGRIKGGFTSRPVVMNFFGASWDFIQTERKEEKD